MNTPSRTTNHTASILAGIAIALIIVTGLIHLVEAPDNFQEAAYKGILFALNGGLALVAAVGIYQGSKTWGWGMGVLVAGGAIVMYVISRTIGLPGIGIDDAWFEPMGVLAVLVEAGFVVTAALMLVRNLNNVDQTTLSASTQVNQYR
ncbi:MAG TPA: hypothetical protein VHL11_23875 [Phototrophicaceae bacterium]|jgi:hypothetical protein|nr:hypothetical protein [Phototrophicaceae bacterium]